MGFFFLSIRSIQSVTKFEYESTVWYFEGHEKKKLWFYVINERKKRMKK